MERLIRGESTDYSVPIWYYETVEELKPIDVLLSHLENLKESGFSHLAFDVTVDWAEHEIELDLRGYLVTAETDEERNDRIEKEKHELKKKNEDILQNKRDCEKKDRELYLKLKERFEK